MNFKIGQYIYGYVPFIGNYYGIYKIIRISDNQLIVTSIISSLRSNNEWYMPKESVTIIFDSSDIDNIKQNYPEFII